MMEKNSFLASTVDRKNQILQQHQAQNEELVTLGQVDNINA